MLVYLFFVFSVASPQTGRYHLLGILHPPYIQVYIIYSSPSKCSFHPQGKPPSCGMREPYKAIRDILTTSSVLTIWLRKPHIWSSESVCSVETTTTWCLSIHLFADLFAPCDTTHFSISTRCVYITKSYIYIYMFNEAIYGRGVIQALGGGWG